jgi:hypothetical protein
MSGPKTTSYRLTDAVADLQRLSQQLEAAARARAEEQRRLEAERQRREAEARARAEEARRREEARLQRLSAARATRRRLALLREQIAGGMASLPASQERPKLPELPEIVDESTGALEALLDTFAGIENRLDEIKARVGTAIALADVDLSWLGEAEPLAQMLERFSAAASGPSSGATALADAQAREAAVTRIVSRLLGASVDELPPAFESLVQQAIGTESAARFDMLCTELRRHVQEHNDRVKARRRAGETAASWLDRLEPLDVQGHCAELREALRQVQDGLRPWDSQIESECRSALDALERAARQRQDARAAQILEASLRDLGYEVDGIEQTIFSEGGAVHFQDRDWGDHFMRLRVSPERGTLHFNMVRSADSPASAARDLELEQQWCRTYPELMKVLAARGIATEPLRALGAGSFAVETVPASALPRRQKTASRREAPAAQRQLPD